MKSILTITLISIVSILFTQNKINESIAAEEIISRAGNLHISYPSKLFHAVVEEFRSETDPRCLGLDSTSYLANCILTGLIFIPINRDVYTNTVTGKPYLDTADEVLRDHNIDRDVDDNVIVSKYPNLKIDTLRNANFIVLKQYVNLKTGKFHIPDFKNEHMDNLQTHHTFKGSALGTYKYLHFNDIDTLQFWKSDVKVNYVFFPISSIIGLMDEPDPAAQTTTQPTAQPATQPSLIREDTSKVILSGAFINYGESIFNTGSGKNIPSIKLERSVGLIKTAVGLPCPVGWKNSFGKDLDVYKKIARNGYNYLRFSAD